ncbi:MAG: PAS domain-containing sensor histidine kinase [bacterium]|nr:PAS domain-containing sensor histidine kinase [bacterium]
MPSTNDAGYRSLLETCTDMLTLYDSSGVTLYSSQAVLQNTGYSAKQLVGNSILEFTHDDDTAHTRDAFAEANRRPSVAIPLAMRERYADDTWHWLEGTLTSLLNEPNVRAVVGSFRDVTIRRRTEDQLRDSQRMMANAERIAHMGSWELDMHASVPGVPNGVRWSDEVYRIYGYESGQIEATIDNFYRFVHPDDREALITKQTNAFISHSKIAVSHRIVRPDGAIRWVHQEGKADVDPVTGMIIRFGGTLRDITDIKLAELERASAVKSLVQRNTDLEQFAFIVSHDLRAPVTTILGLASLLEYEELDKKTTDECVAGLVTSVKKLDDTIKDLNAIIDVSIIPLDNHDTVWFGDIVRDVCLSLGIDEDDFTITTDFSSVDVIHILKSYMYSIFYNLIANSVKYRRLQTSEASLHIESSRTENTVQLVFSDNGLGINLTAHENDIFGLHKRFHPDIEGRGMGLYMVKKQVEALGGTIAASSIVNKGTAFTLTFAV